jgi:hypothetical protein
MHRKGFGRKFMKLRAEALVGDKVEVKGVSYSILYLSLSLWYLGLNPGPHDC